MELKRVVVTGLGVVTPIGNDVQTMWDAMLQGKSGAGPITRFDASKFRTQFACEVKDFDASSFMDRAELRKMDLCSEFALYCAEQAMDDAAFDLENENKHRMGVIWGSGMGGVKSYEENVSSYVSNGNPRFNPFFVPKVISNMTAGHIAILFSLQGVNFTTVSACASSNHAIINAYNYIRLNKADVILTGGSEAAIEVTGIGGFNAMHALSTRNDEPLTASRPFSASRDGFVLGEGGGCLVLEEYEHARRRGAHIYAEIVGTGANDDAYHMTAPDAEGKGAAEVMQLALEESGLRPSDIDYINTHGTSTPLGDVAEVNAIKEVFGEYAYKLNISSTKSMTGHLLGGTGAVEAVASIMAIQHDIIPPTINHQEGDEDEHIDYKLNFTFNKPQHRVVNYALSNNFCFGGHNACLIFKKPEA